MMNVKQLPTSVVQVGLTRRHSPKLKQLSAMAGEFSVEMGLLLRVGQIVVPPTLRADLLRRVHKGHQGITKC